MIRRWRRWNSGLIVFVAVMLGIFLWLFFAGREHRRQLPVIRSLVERYVAVAEDYTIPPPALYDSAAEAAPQNETELEKLDGFFDAKAELKTALEPLFVSDSRYLDLAVGEFTAGWLSYLQALPSGASRPQHPSRQSFELDWNETSIIHDEAEHSVYFAYNSARGGWHQQLDAGLLRTAAGWRLTAMDQRMLLMPLLEALQLPEEMR
ncbi:MAG: hypothetical protein QM296_10260 [Bacillota bacterium]|nr:hypothetical protein [Bacillota bacterium]